MYVHMHCLFFFLVFVMQQKIKRFCIFLFFILTTMLTAQIPVFAEADTDSKDAGLAEYYDTQLNLPKNQVVKARIPSETLLNWQFRTGLSSGSMKK